MHVHRLVLAIALLCASCISHRQHRLDYDLCTNDAGATCEQAALHEHGDAQADYFLGFIEFDDQGQLWDRKQAAAVIDHLEVTVPGEDLLMVVFVHGWKHCAKDGDTNIAMFRENLARLAVLEERISARSGVPPRKVAGVYIGWRGGSISVPWVEQLTFWDRKSTAHKVGHGSVTEVLARLETLRSTRGAMSTTKNTKLVVIGHSFGGAVVFSALSEVLEQRFVATTGGAGVAGAAAGFGDLVVLINPAFEALRFAPLSDMSIERGSYPRDQLPVLAVLTSKSDYATGLAFPIGRFFSTVFEKDRRSERRNGFTKKDESIVQSTANRCAVGHFEPFRTHSLVPSEDFVEPVPDEEYLATAEAWEANDEASALKFPGTVLHRRDSCAPRHPYLVVEVDKSIIPDHNSIDDPRVIQFLAQLILMAAQEDDPKLRAARRSQARGE